MKGLLSGTVSLSIAMILLTACAPPAPPVVDFHQQCVDRVNQLRGLEKLSTLQRDTSLEACSDQDAKTNYERNTPHLSMCGQAQNECSTHTSTTSILDTCIEQQMYRDEKACYGKNPGGCYSDQACMCGHFVNMMDKKNYGYTKVACGLYTTPKGELKAVLNFFK
jgi:hypothetical protein